jgi:glycerophosphoryl diester phosphodiesterase
LLDQLADGELKQQLSRCQNLTFQRSNFSIAHRGASLQFPEHTREAYIAAARMGAGIIECDVTFTKDKQLVCRHAQCDLHRTTDILTRPKLAKKCSVPFTPADPNSNRPAAARCCTSDITLAEFRSLQGKMDGANLDALNAESYLQGTANWRTDLYAATGTLVSFADSIDLFRALNVKMTPELKAPEVPMPFAGTFTQEAYAESVVQLLLEKNVSAKQVFLQSFSWPDIQYWLEHHPEFGKQAVYLDDRMDSPNQLEFAIESLPELKAQGLNIIAPPLWALLSLDNDNNIVASDYATTAKKTGLGIITWTLERSGHISKQEDDYYRSFQSAITSEGDIYRVLEVLHKDLSVLGVFSDWPAAVTYYANCMGIE